MENPVYQKMCQDLIDLVVNVGLMNAVMGQYPEDVQERWTERMEAYSQFAREQTEEIHQFAESYDGE